MGKADYKYLDEVITQCEGRINRIEAEYNRVVKKGGVMNKKSEEKQQQEMEIDDVFNL